MSNRGEHNARNRRYTDAEVRLLLEQASQVQGQRPTARLAGAPLRMDIRRILPFEVDESELHGLISGQDSTSEG
jgi:hypothetical protein